MSANLKSGTTLRLALFLAGNAVAFIVLLSAREVAADSFTDIATGLRALLPVGLAVVATTALSGVISSESKGRIVFLRWRDPLPGSEAFSRHAKLDPRIDGAALLRRVGTYPTTARAQNAAWYKLYLEVANEPAVTQGHRDFLLMRDVAVLALLLWITLGTAAFASDLRIADAGTYFALLAAQFLVARRAAENYGQRLVCTVLAHSSARTVSS